MMNSISGEQYTAFKSRIEQSICDSKKGIPSWMNRIFDIITVNYYMSNFK